MLGVGRCDTGCPVGWRRSSGRCGDGGRPRRRRRLPKVGYRSHPPGEDAALGTYTSGVDPTLFLMVCWLFPDVQLRQMRVLADKTQHISSFRNIFLKRKDGHNLNITLVFNINIVLLL